MTTSIKRFVQSGSAMIETFGPNREPKGDWVRAEDYDAATAWQRLPVETLAHESAALSRYLVELERLIARLTYAAPVAGL